MELWAEDLRTDRLCCVERRGASLPTIWSLHRCNVTRWVKIELSGLHFQGLTCVSWHWVCVIFGAQPSYGQITSLSVFSGLDMFSGVCSQWSRPPPLLNYLRVKGNRQVWWTDVRREGGVWKQQSLQSKSAVNKITTQKAWPVVGTTNQNHCSLHNPLNKTIALLMVNCWA